MKPEIEKSCAQQKIVQYASENPSYQKAVNLLADLIIDHLKQHRPILEDGLVVDIPESDGLGNAGLTNDCQNESIAQTTECRTHSAA